mmetsp:Transcript_21784/g.31708  ORF Transcript_21784/g.31708 Transcript_21784/m.31708 type:complete len:609 (-) Transcript_21784:418-2244(-)
MAMTVNNESVELPIHPRSRNPTEWIIDEPSNNTSYVQLGKESMNEAEKLKFDDPNQSQQLYHHAAMYFSRAAESISDEMTKAAMRYLSQASLDNAKFIQHYCDSTVADGKVNESFYPAPIALNWQEIDGNRPTASGSRGKVSGISKIPKAEEKADNSIDDLLILESKLEEIGLMPPSALLRDDKSALSSSTARLNFLSSNLGESFMFLSSSMQLGNSVSFSGPRLPGVGVGERKPKEVGYFPSTNTDSTNATSAYGPYGIASKKPNPPSSTTSADQASERPGGTYWGAAAEGLLAWATPRAPSERPPVPGQPVSNPPAAGYAMDASINWNDKSGIMAGTTGDSGGADGMLKLLDTIERLSAENSRLENAVQTLKAEKKKNQILLQQVDSFKKEYKTRLQSIKSKMVADRSTSQENGADHGRRSGDNEYSSRNRMNELERTVKGLMGRISELKAENEKKDKVLRAYKARQSQRDHSHRSDKNDIQEVNADGVGGGKEKEHVQPPTVSVSVGGESIAQRSTGEGSFSPVDGIGTHTHRRRDKGSPRSNHTLSARRMASASPSTATLQTSLQREMSGGYPPGMGPQHSSKQQFHRKELRRPQQQQRYDMTR